jgi:hypothetical protein
VRGAEICKGAGLRKSVRINEACVVKSSLVAVHIIRGTVLSVGSARIAAGNTVVVAGPGPSHSVAHRDVDCVRHKHEPALPDRYIYNLTSARRHAAHRRVAVLIHNVNGGGRLMLLLRCGGASVTRFSVRRK